MAYAMRRIATEEAFSIPEVAQALRDLCAGRTGASNIDMMLVRNIYGDGAGYQDATSLRRCSISKANACATWMPMASTCSCCR